MKLTQSDLSQLCEVAKLASKKAGEYIQSQFDKNYQTNNKVGAESLASQVVTEVDFKAQEIILDHLKNTIEKYDLGILTEESTDDHTRLQKDYFWCIDPMDGTLPFTEKRTGYSVSIALISQSGHSVIGVVYIPDLKECYSGYTGSGVYLNDQSYNPISTGSRLHFYMDQSFMQEPYYEWVINQFQRLEQKSQNLSLEFYNRFGGVRNAIGVMISGNGCYFKFPKKKNGCGSIWDYAATQLLFNEVGLKVYDIQGNHLNLNDPETTFMNRVGILYASSATIASFIIQKSKEWESKN